MISMISLSVGNPALCVSIQYVCAFSLCPISLADTAITACI